MMRQRGESASTRCRAAGPDLAEELGRRGAGGWADGGGLRGGGGGGKGGRGSGEGGRR